MCYYYGAVNRCMDEWVTVERVDVERGPVRDSQRHRPHVRVTKWQREEGDEELEEKT